MKMQKVIGAVTEEGPGFKRKGSCTGQLCENKQVTLVCFSRISICFVANQMIIHVNIYCVFPWILMIKKQFTFLKNRIYMLFHLNFKTCHCIGPQLFFSQYFKEYFFINIQLMIHVINSDDCMITFKYFKSVKLKIALRLLVTCS